jgi:FkbM family methyltransferase
MIAEPDLPESRERDGEIALLKSLLTDRSDGPVDAFVDGGANVGVFSLVAASMGVRTLAFEPHPLTLRQLLYNVHANQDRLSAPIEVYPMALSEKTAVMPLFGGGQGASLVGGWGGMSSTYDNLVPTVTLDSILGDRRSITRPVVKLDLEGAEWMAVRGAAELLRRSPRPVWMIEMGLTENFESAPSGKNPEFAALFERFWSEGYASYSAPPPGESARRLEAADVDMALASGRRPWGGINVVFR